MHISVVIFYFEHNPARVIISIGVSNAQFLHGVSRRTLIGYHPNMFFHNSVVFRKYLLNFRRIQITVLRDDHDIAVHSFSLDSAAREQRSQRSVGSP